MRIVNEHLQESEAFAAEDYPWKTCELGVTNLPDSAYDVCHDRVEPPVCLYYENPFQLVHFYWWPHYTFCVMLCHMNTTVN